MRYHRFDFAFEGEHSKNFISFAVFYSFATYRICILCSNLHPELVKEIPKIDTRHQTRVVFCYANEFALEKPSSKAFKLDSTKAVFVFVLMAS